MTRRLFVAVAVALALSVLAAAYGATAASDSARAACAHRDGVVRGDACVRDGRILLTVPR